MPENYFYQPDPWQVAAGAMNREAGSLGNVLQTIQQNRMLQRQMLMRQQQLDYQRTLAEQHGQLFEAQTALTNKRAEAEQQKLLQANALHELAQRVGRATTTAKTLQNVQDPSLAGLEQFVQGGQVPAGNYSRGDLIHLMQALAAGAATESAASTPSSAQRLIEGYNIPEGGVRANPIEGVTDFGMPKQQRTSYRNVAPGSMVINPDTGELIFQAPPKEATQGNRPLTQSEALRSRMSEAGQTFKKLPENMRLMIDQVITNAPGMRLPTTSQGEVKQLDAETAKQFLQKAGGDKEKARQLAREAGFTF